MENGCTRIIMTNAVETSTHLIQKGHVCEGARLLALLPPVTSNTTTSPHTPPATPAPHRHTDTDADRRGHRGVGVTGIAMQLRGRFGPGLDALLRRLAGYKRAITKAAGRDGGRSPQEWRKLLSVALAKYTAATILSATGHKA